MFLRKRAHILLAVAIAGSSSDEDAICSPDPFWVEISRISPKPPTQLPFPASGNLHAEVSRACAPLQQSTTVLWIAGPPGAGKTTTSSRFQTYGFQALDCEDRWTCHPGRHRNCGNFDVLERITRLSASRNMSVVFGACREAFLRRAPAGVIPVLLLPGREVYTARWQARQVSDTRYRNDTQPHERRYNESVWVATNSSVAVIYQPHEECVDRTVLRICKEARKRLGL